jgi:hypothetical protein
MPYINLPPVASELFWDLDRRIRALETAFRFNMPNVNFNTSIPTNPRTGDLYYDTYAQQVTYWNGIEWVVLSDDNLGVPVVPFTSTWSGTGLAYTGTPTSAQYSRVGKMITFYIKVNCTTVTNFGTGQYHLTLPFAPFNNFVFRNGGLHDTSANVHYSILGDSHAGSTDIELLYSRSQGSHVEDSAFDHNSPLNLATADFFYLSGTYFIA